MLVEKGDATACPRGGREERLNWTDRPTTSERRGGKRLDGRRRHKTTRRRSGGGGVVLVESNRGELRTEIEEPKLQPESNDESRIRRMVWQDGGGGNGRAVVTSGVVVQSEWVSADTDLDDPGTVQVQSGGEGDKVEQVE